jgi:5'-nucleotidase
VLYSGTVAAAMEGRFLGIPSIAVSLVGSEHFTTAGALVRRLVERNATDPLPVDAILNVNVPDVPLAEVKGIRVTRLGFRHKSEPAVKALDPHNRPIYWIGPAGAGQDAGPGTDFDAVAAGYVSVSPVKVDLTAHAALAKVGEWFERFR